MSSTTLSRKLTASMLDWINSHYKIDIFFTNPSSSLKRDPHSKQTFKACFNKSALLELFRCLRARLCSLFSPSSPFIMAFTTSKKNSTNSTNQPQQNHPTENIPFDRLLSFIPTPPFFYINKTLINHD